MIVCLCNRVSDRDIQHAVKIHGVRNFEVLKDMTQAASCCGCCHECAREVFDAACHQQGTHQNVAAPACA